MLILNDALHAAIRAHGVTSFPYEGCGLLLGLMENGHHTVKAIRPLSNVWPVEAEKTERFRISEADLVDVIMEAEENGMEVIGIFHSHPNHPPIASPRDLEWATWPNYSYLITEIRDGRPINSRSWQLAADRSGFTEEEVLVASDE